MKKKAAPSPRAKAKSSPAKKNRASRRRAAGMGRAAARSFAGSTRGSSRAATRSTRTGTTASSSASANPAITYRHAPIEWRFDLNPRTNPFLMERLGVNATLNPGAFLWKGKVHMVVRFEGYDRKSLFAIAESPNGIDNWRFWDEPVDLPEMKPETNVYDMRVTFHEDGWIYGVFCAEAKDPSAKPGDLSSAVAVAGMVRTRDFRKWERLPNLKTPGLAAAKRRPPPGVRRRQVRLLHAPDGRVHRRRLRRRHRLDPLRRHPDRRDRPGGHHRRARLPHDQGGEERPGRPPRSRRPRAGCTSPTACAPAPRAFATSSTCS